MPTNLAEKCRKTAAVLRQEQSHTCDMPFALSPQGGVISLEAARQRDEVVAALLDEVVECLEGIEARVDAYEAARVLKAGLAEIDEKIAELRSMAAALPPTTKH